METTIRKSVTWAFNIALFLYLVLIEIGAYFFGTDANTPVPFDSLFDHAPALALTFAIALFFILIFLGALVLRAFWNRLISNIFSLRILAYSEAVAIILMLSVLKEI